MSFTGLTLRHNMQRLTIYREPDFRRDAGLGVRIGLCAGLVNVWSTELCNGNDAIRSIQQAAPSLVQKVLVGQAVSFYLKSLPASDHSLTVAESVLLNIKYGEGRVASVRALIDRLKAKDLLELDIMLHYKMPIVQSLGLSTYSASDVVTAVSGFEEVGLYVFVFRFWDSQRVSQRGHRIAIRIEKQSWTFYDPALGEVQCSCADSFLSWFHDYWSLTRWERVLSRAAAPHMRQVRVFLLRGSLDRDAAIVATQQHERWSSDFLFSGDIRQWLEER